MNLKTNWILFGILAVMLIALSVLLPLYFIKWKDSGSKALAAGTIASGSPVVVQVKAPWFYPQFFSAVANRLSITKFSTNAQGVAFYIDITTPITSNGGGTMTSVDGNGKPFFSYKKISRNPGYTSYEVTFWSHISNGIAIATLSQINAQLKSSVIPVTDTASRGAFYISDDGKQLLVGKIKSDGLLSPLTNIEPTFDVEIIPNTCFVTGFPNYSITDYISTEPFNTTYGPIVNGVGNLVSTAPLIPGMDPSSRLQNSSEYFMYRIPLLFNSSLLAGGNTTDGNIVYYPLISMSTITNAGIFKSGWSLATLTEASAVFTTASFYNFNINPTTNTSFDMVLQATANQINSSERGSDMYATMFTKNNTGTTVISLSPTDVYADRALKSALWLVKYNNNATSPLTRIPSIIDVMDLNVTMGVLGSLSPVTQTPISTPPPPTNPPPKSQSSTTSVTATLEASGSTVFSLPKSNSFLEQNGLYIYVSIGVVGSLVVLVGIWYWSKFHVSVTSTTGPVAPPAIT